MAGVFQSNVFQHNVFQVDLTSQTLKRLNEAGKSLRHSSPTKTKNTPKTLRRVSR